MNDARVGVVGGGQLALMLGEAAADLGLAEFVVLDPTPGCPAARVATRHILGAFNDSASLRTLGAACDVLTFEIELADAAILNDLASSGVTVEPAPVTLATIQDKLRQKEYLAGHGIAVAPFCSVDEPSVAAVTAAATRLGNPLILKARRGGYDGRGNAVIRGHEDIADALARLEHRPVYAEAVVPFVKELAVMVVRTTGGDIVAYPVVETMHVRHICDMTVAPARVSDQAAVRATAVAVQAVATLSGAGIFGVELFLTADDTIYLNEIAPRPHNSGHYTIEGCETSQFSQHLRAITGRPLGPTTLLAPAVVMVNILGTNAQPGPRILMW